jgi:hypothetical protein
MEVGKNYGTNNRLITGNTFNSNGVSIYLDDTWNNIQKNQSWSTITGNTWDASGVWVRYYQWNGTTNAQFTARPYTTGTVFAQSSNTFPDTISAPSNLTATDTGTGILLDWDAPVGGGYLPERYAISWSGSLGGGGIATGNVGGANALNTSIEIPYSVVYSFGEEGETFPFHIRSDNDTFSKYSANSNTVSIQVGASTITTDTSSTTSTTIPTPADSTSTTSTTTSTSTTTTIPVEPEPEQSTTTTQPVVVVAPVEPEPETTIPEDTTPDTEETLPEETETEETLPDTSDETVPSETETETESGPLGEPSAETEEIQDAIDELPVDASPDEIAEIVGEALIDATAEEVAEVLTTVFEDATQEEVVAILTTVFEDASSEEVVAILSETFADGATDEEVAAVTEALLVDGVTEEAVSTLIDVLESGVIDESQVEAVVDAILQEELNEEVATELATSAAIIQNITAEQATDIFESVPVGELSDSEGAEIVNAVQDAPVEVKESFEEEINVFAGVFDTYVPLDSAIDVGTRRSVIAVNLVTSTVALAGAAGGLPTPSSSTSTPKQDMAARKPEEEEAEEGGAIEGEGPDWIKRISIYKYENGERVMDWKNFTKKFVYGVMASGFTLAGAVVMYFTLSGFTQQVALWGTSIAFACAMYLHMKEPDGE